MNKQFTPDAGTRSEKRRQKKLDQQRKGNAERAEMKKRAEAKVSFGTWTVFGPPNPKSRVNDFTMAFSKPLQRNELYAALSEALGETWGTTRSIRITLSNPPAWQVTRRRILNALEGLFIEKPKGE